LDERRSYWAWAASIALHGAVLVLILLGFASAPRFEDNPETIPVDTVSLSDLNQIMNGEKDARPAPEPPPRPEPAPRPMPPAPTPKPPEPPDLRAAVEPAPEPPPRSEPLQPPKEQPPPSPPKSVENAPEPPVRPKEPPPSPQPSLPKSVENAPEPPERPKELEPEKPKQDQIAKALERETSEAQPKPARVYDPNAIAKLIGQPRLSTTSTAAREGNAAPLGLPHRDAPRMSLSLASALDAWLTESYLNCWTPPPVMPDGDVYVAEIKVVFNPDGSLSTRPVLLNPPTDPAWRPHAESAMRAVKKCDPLHVPPQYAPYFEEWKVETIHFDPRETQG
jgi:colicin import membrane protein